MKNNDLMTIMAQAFYGNRTVTSICPEEFDAFMLGYLNFQMFEKMRDREKIDRTIIRLPGTENLVLVYNKYQEEESLKDLQDFIKKIHESRQRFNPTAVIPELGIVLFSRCVVCRTNNAGELISIEKGDDVTAVKYLTA